MPGGHRPDGEVSRVGALLPQKDPDFCLVPVPRDDVQIRPAGEQRDEAGIRGVRA